MSRTDREFGNSLIAKLDFSDLSSVQLSKASSELKQATRECGFIYVHIGNQHATTIQNMRRAQRSFFAQSVENKNAIAIDENNRGYLAEGMAKMHGAKRTDQKEVYFWGREADNDDPDVIAGLPLCGPNQWPDIEGFKSAVTDYSSMVQSVGDKLLQTVAVALGASPSFFEAYYERCMLRGQLLCYPPTDNHPDQFGVAAHSDFGCITLLLQETDGLEVLFPNGHWVEAPPAENTLVVNVGDLLERWSNHSFPSTKHRVRNQNSDARFSIAMFYDPSPAAVIDSTDLLPGEPARYPAVKAAEYILGRNKGAFEHYKNDVVV